MIFSTQDTWRMMLVFSGLHGAKVASGCGKTQLGGTSALSHLPELFHALHLSQVNVWRLGGEHKKQAVEVEGTLHEFNPIPLHSHIEGVTAQLKLQEFCQQA